MQQAILTMLLNKIRGIKMEKQYIISEGELLSLLDSQRELSALQAAGVDNWDCGDISELFDREIDAEDLEEMYQLYASL
jgi:hypothetical protein